MELYIYICVQCTIYTVHTKTGWDAVRGAFWCGQKIAALPLQCSQYLFYVMLHFFLTFATFLLDFLHFSYTYYNVSIFVEVKFAEKSWIRIERDISRAERMFSPYLDHQHHQLENPSSQHQNPLPIHHQQNHQSDTLQNPPRQIHTITITKSIINNIKIVRWSNWLFFQIEFHCVHLCPSLSCCSSLVR